MVVRPCFRRYMEGQSPREKLMASVDKQKETLEVRVFALSLPGPPAYPIACYTRADCAPPPSVLTIFADAHDRTR